MKKIALLLAILLPSLSASADTSGECGENLTWKYEEATQTLTISGSGAMDDYYSYQLRKAPWYDYRNVIREVIIEEGVTTIGVSAFDHCSAMTVVTIPSGVTTIGEAAFSGCTALSSIDIPNSVTNIGNMAFFGSGLTSVVIPNSVTKIGYEAFDHCKDLTSATISKNMGSLSYRFFCDCTNLTSVILPEGVTTIGEDAFSGCTGLTSITIPCSVTTIDKYAFEGCSNLTSLTVSGNLYAIGGDAFKDCRQITDIRIVVSDRSTFCKSNTISLIYDKIEGLASFVDTPPVLVGYKLVTLLDVYGNEIKDYVIPSDVTRIYADALSKCGGLNSITIPSSVTSIGNFAFSWCESLTDVYCYASTVPWTYSGVFSNSNLKNATLHVPASSINDYKSRDPWKGFKNIVPLETETQTAYRPFVEEGKVWKVGTVSGNPVQVVDYYYFDGDTIIDGKTCKQMMCQRYVAPDYSDEDWTPEPSLSYVGAWYEENQKVYLYDERTQSMTLKYDFSIVDNGKLHLIYDYLSFIIGPKQTGELKGFKGVYRDVMTNKNIKSTTWLEGIGGIDGPMRNVYAEAADHAPEFLMSCTVGDEVIYLNDEYEDGATPEFNEARDRIDFTHTIKIRPKAPRRRETMHSMYGEYNGQQLGLNLNSLNNTYQVSITDEAGKALYEKTVDAGTIVGLNIDISAYAKGRYTVTLENNSEVFTGEFGTLTTGIEAARDKAAAVKGTIYDLQGRRVDSPSRRGVYIKDGRKIIR